MTKSEQAMVRSNFIDSWPYLTPQQHWQLALTAFGKIEDPAGRSHVAIMACCYRGKNERLDSEKVVP